MANQVYAPINRQNLQQVIGDDQAVVIYLSNDGTINDQVRGAAGGNIRLENDDTWTISNDPNGKRYQQAFVKFTKDSTSRTGYSIEVEGSGGSKRSRKHRKSRRAKKTRRHRR